MKRLLERLRSPSGDTGAADAFFTTQFLECSDDTQALVDWRSRAQETGAAPFDRDEGATRLVALWGADHSALALDAAQLQVLAARLEYAAVPAGVEVIGQDEQGDYLLIVLEGTIAVERTQPWGGRARLAEARAGDLLGEMSLLDAGARFSACTTLTPCAVAALDARQLDALMREQPPLALALLAALARRLSLRLRQVSARLSALLSR